MRGHRLVVALLFCLTGSILSGQVSAPSLGVVRYASGDVYPVLGVAGNYVLGQRAWDRVETLSSSGKGALLLRAGRLLLVDEKLSVLGTYEAPSGAGTLASLEGDLTSAIAWLPTQKLLVHWSGHEFVPVPVPDAIDGVFSVAKIESDRALLFARGARGTVEEITISLLSRSIVGRNVLPETGDIYRRPNLRLSAADGELTVSTQKASGKALGLPAKDLIFERASDSSVHILAKDGGRDWMLHVRGDQATLFELPEPRTEALVGAVQP